MTTNDFAKIDDGVMFFSISLLLLACFDVVGLGCPVRFFRGVDVLIDVIL